ncbi:MAG: stage II sporulation protein P [Clostridiales bacterium]|nr:stage II sporulation protein P [Clostridiales bacterium]
MKWKMKRIAGLLIIMVLFLLYICNPVVKQDTLRFGANIRDQFLESWFIYMTDYMLDEKYQVSYTARSYWKMDPYERQREKAVKEAEDENARQKNALSENQEARVLTERKIYISSNDILTGDSYQEELLSSDWTSEEKIKLGANENMILKLKKEKSLSYLIENFFVVHSTTTIDKNVFQVDKLLSTDCKMQKKKKKKQPQILIYHTHGGSETFIDSREGKKEDSIIGVGTELSEELKVYGYNVLHDKTEYDRINGKIDRSRAYTVAEKEITKTLKEYPSIEVVIDLHRDAAAEGGGGLVTTIDGKKTAQIMLFNGLSRNLKGEISYLKNPNLQANLAFSLQVQMASLKEYPEFSRKIYLKPYRYNLHLRKKSLLIELGNHKNTVSEAKNAAKPLARIIHEVLSGQ